MDCYHSLDASGEAFAINGIKTVLAGLCNYLAIDKANTTVLAN